MKKNYFKFLALALFAFTVKANAQCSSCTTTISTTDPSNYVISSGQTFCVTSTGNMTGLITVSAGGTLCNSGNINSTDLWVAGGTLNNYGTINTNRILVSAAGVYNNYVSGTATMDSILITNFNSALNNFGTINTIRLGNSDNSLVTNEPSAFITADYVGDSSAQFNNNTNSTLTINFDFYNAYSSGFFNSGRMHIYRDFYNSTSSTFETDCMLQVDRDWYNSAIILGPGLGSGCGGFNVVAGTYNSGTIGNLSTTVDICDVGNPPFGMDGPGGTIATTTTYCACFNTCILFGINEPTAQSSVMIQNIYPNPSSSQITIELQNKEAEELVVEVMDMLGRKQSSVRVNSIAGLTSTSVDVSKLAQGTYILNITDSKKLQSKQLFSIVK